MVAGYKCLFNFFADDCISKAEPSNQLSLLMCYEHLAGLYGVELSYQEHDTPTTIETVGGSLRPCKGVIFYKNTVIFPERDFYDMSFHGKIKTGDHQNYFMNPNIAEFRDILTSKKDKSPNGKFRPCDRYVIEQVRNLSKDTEHLTASYDESEQSNSTPKSLMVSKKSGCEAMIKDTYWYKYYIPEMVFYNYNPTSGEHLHSTNASKVESTDLSISMLYLLSKCWFSLAFANNRVEPIPPNAEYRKGIGLVATEDISWPSCIVIHGLSAINSVYLDEMVHSHPKKFNIQKLTARDIPAMFSRQRLFYGSGLPDCMFGG